MGGRLDVRRLVVTTLPALVLAITLVLLPSMGSRLVPAAALVASTPAATVVHLLGDEVAPAPPGPAPELRARASSPDDLRVALVLAAVAVALVLGAGRWRRRATPLVPVPVARPMAPGRSPPPLLDR